MVISPLITSPYLSRVLGAEKIGIYNYCYSIAYYFGIFAILGISNYGNRSIAQINKNNKEQRSQLFWEIVGMQFFSSFWVILLYVLFIELYGGVLKKYYYIELLYLFSVAFDISWFFFGIESVKNVIIRSSLVKIISLFLIVLYVKNENDLGLYIFIMAGGNFFSNIILWTFLRRELSRCHFCISKIKNHFPKNIKLFIPVISLALFHYMDKVMLGFWSSMSELGYYCNADKVINIPLGIISGLGVVMMPRISSLVATNSSWSSINKLINISILYSMWIGSAICFGIISIADDFVPFFFGPGYERCIDILSIFAPVVLIKAWSNIFKMQCLIPMEKDKQYILSVVIAAIVNIIFNLFLIPVWGAVGATIGTIIAEFLVAFFYTYFSWDNIDIKNSCFVSLLFVLSGLFMFLLLRLTSEYIVELSRFMKIFIKITIGIFFYSTISSFIFFIFYSKKKTLDLKNELKTKLY